MSKTTLLKISKNTKTKIETVEQIIKIHLALKDIRIGDSLIQILAYFIVYGINPDTKKLLVESGLAKSQGSIKWYIHKLRAVGLMYRDDLNGRIYICKDLDLSVTPVTGLYIQLNINNNEY